MGGTTKLSEVSKCIFNLASLEAMELVNVNPVYAAPAVMDHAYVEGSLQGTGSAGYVPAGTNVVGTAPFVPVFDCGE